MSRQRPKRAVSVVFCGHCHGAGQRAILEDMGRDRGCEIVYVPCVECDTTGRLVEEVITVTHPFSSWESVR